MKNAKTGQALGKKRMSTETLVLGAILSALVVVLQLLGSFIRFGPFSISLVLIPIVIGAATCGTAVGAWLGGVFGLAVLLSGDAATFMAINVPGTIITVMLKGILCGLAAGLIYKLFENRNRYLAVIAAAIVCPLVNTGIFLLGCMVFFLDTLSEWGAGAGHDNVFVYMIVGLVGLNFVFELISNVVLSPASVRLIALIKKK
ncbi:MAG: ECF transporter S component [Clostridia bacterium]|nr:ECF transporter S component [Clostridia bacterium]